MSKSNLSAANPVFVVGVFRSGTSLLYSLLNRHPQISLMYECNAWDFPALFKWRRFAGDWLARQEFFNQALSRHRLVWGGSLRGLEKVRTPDDLYRVHGEQKGATLWGEKSPFYSTRLRQLGRQYPNATFIFIWRNPVEIYRSMLMAGRRAPFFRKPGMLHRLVYHQEQLLRQSAWLSRREARVRHVNYDDLVDRPEQTCRSLCEFLEVNFEPAMLELAQADFSAVYDVPHQKHLRRGVIERQKFSEDPVPPAVAEKLERFHKRWQRLFGRPLAARAATAATPEPTWLELLYHKTLGWALHLGTDVKRLSFEILPLPWLRTYRQFKNWVVAGKSPARRGSLVGDFLENGVTVIGSLVLLAGVVVCDFLTGPDVSVGPLYLLPCAVMTLVVGGRWGAVTAFLCAVSITFFREGVKNQFHLPFTGVVLWNAAMRFIFFGIFVLLLNRIRLEINRDEPRQNPADGIGDKSPE